ncbi:MAG: exodeoxyribonuclease V subunit gamma [Kiritimatiellaeota bacterium]|nr:exodeoxyribonuclease V subunit gamma [Kiritimatiellota bacterium]
MPDIVSIKIIFSDFAEKLAELLADDLRNERMKGDLFESLQVLVPNKNMAEYLKISIAERSKVCANVEFPFLEGGLWNVLTRLREASGISRTDPVRLDSKTLAQMVMLALSDDSKDELEPFRAFFMENGEVSKLKLWQLCERMATRFLEYEMHRPDMVEGWSRGTARFADAADGDLIRLEKAQMFLHNAIFAEGGIAFAAQNRRFTLFQYADVVCDEIAERGGGPFPFHLRVFTPSRLSNRHRDLLFRLGQLINVTIYHLNVCAEFWEDVSTPAEDKWRVRLRKTRVSRNSAPDSGSASTEIFEELEPPGELENQLLKEFGKPGREMLKIYSDLEEDAAFANARFENHWIDASEESTESGSLLRAVQNAVRTRTNPSSPTISPAEMRSLQICASPSIHREVESVHDSILFNMSRNQDLRLSDIAVLVVDMKRYQPVLKSVFDAKSQNGFKPVPYSLVDSNAAVESHYARGIESLIAVLEKDFPRDDVFALFRNPCFQQAVACDDGEVLKWLDAIEALGVFRGWDKLYEPPELEGLFSWSNGLKRLRLGCVTDGLEEVNGLFPLDKLDSESTGKLSLVLERLRDFRALTAFNGSVDEWRSEFTSFLDEFLAIPDDIPQEESVRASIVSTFERLTILRDAGTILDFDDVRTLIRAETASIPAGRGRYLSGGVVMATLQPMRPIPFKLVYILGLDESSFPGSPENDAMDLRLRSRKIGDVNRVESMKYLFLETLMCVREKLYLSYVARDVKKETITPPSSVVRMVARNAAPLVPEKFKAMGDDGFETFPECVVPLIGSEPECFIPPTDDSPFDFNFSYSTANWILAAMALRENAPAKLAAALKAATESQNLDIAELAKTATRILSDDENHRKPMPRSVRSVSTRNNIEQVNLNDLKAFLENPLDATLKRYGVDIDDGDDPALAANEPFSIDALGKYTLFTDASELYFKNPAYSEKLFSECLRDAYERNLRKSLEPIPLFTDLNKIFDPKHEDALADFRSSLTALSPLDGPILFGDAEPASTPTIALPPLRLALDDGREVELSGVSGDLWRESTGKAMATLVLTSGKKSKLPKQLIPPFLFWCAMLADADAAHVVSNNFQVYMIFGNDQRICSLTPECLTTIGGSKNTPASYLKSLIATYLDSPFDYLPYSATEKLNIFDAGGAERLLKTGRNKLFLEYRISELPDETLLSLKTKLEEILEEGFEREYSPLLKVLKPAPPEDALEKYHERLAPIFHAANA